MSHDANDGARCGSLLEDDDGRATIRLRQRCGWGPRAAGSRGADHRVDDRRCQAELEDAFDTALMRAAFADTPTYSGTVLLWTV